MNIQLKVVSMKGQVLCGLQMNSWSTVRDLKYTISSRMFRQQVATMNLIYKAKYLNNEDSKLQEYGLAPSNKEYEVHLVARLEGGGRNAVQEIAYQLKFVKSGRLHGVVEIEPEDEFTWNLLIRGPSSTPYSDCLFSITFQFPHNYPYSPPSIKFNTPIFHPNIFQGGRVCWHEDDTTGSKYFADVLIGAINVLLEVPNTASPANSEAARLYVNDRAEFNRRARQLALQFPALSHI